MKNQVFSISAALGSFSFSVVLVWRTPEWQLHGVKESTFIYVCVGGGACMCAHMCVCMYVCRAKEVKKAAETQYNKNLCQVTWY